VAITLKKQYSIGLQAKLGLKGPKIVLITVFHNDLLHFQVRREKINERLRFLKDLVPGCSKVALSIISCISCVNYYSSVEAS
jgi:hypothetical protein